MNKRILKKRVASLLLIFMMLLGVMTENENVLAENKKVDFHIINLSITDSQGNVPPDGFYYSTLFKLNVGFDASKFGDTLRADDYCYDTKKLLAGKLIGSDENLLTSLSWG